jgi:hypothetical protein
MTTFRYCLMVCGLSQEAAAEFLGVRIDTVKSWCAGRSNPPSGVWRLLASLFEQILNTAEGAAEVMDLEGIDPRAYGAIEADIPGHELPQNGAVKAAGAMALLMSVAAADA